MGKVPPLACVPTSELLGIEVVMQFAPIRRLDDGALAGAELQLRGPSGSALASAQSLRRAARLMDQKITLDRAACALAKSATVDTVAEHLPLLVNIDLDSLEDTGRDVSEDGKAGLRRLVVSVRAKDVFHSPHDTLVKVADARATGRVIALDGLGTDDHAATLLALIEPDIIVTSADFLTRTDDLDIAQLAHALSAHIERSSAVVIAEGVDTELLAQAARTLGATYGVGALYPAVDDPKDLLDEPIVALPERPVWNTPPTPGLNTPYAIAAVQGIPRRGTKRLLDQMSKALEAQAVAIGPTMLILGTFQHSRHYTSVTAARWRHLADTIGYAGVYGVGLNYLRDGNIQHAPLDPDDELVNEWTVVVLGPHHTALLTARDLHDNGSDLDRTFDFIQSFDRVTVTQAVHSILRRFTSHQA